MPSGWEGRQLTMILVRSPLSNLFLCALRAGRFVPLIQLACACSATVSAAAASLATAA